MPNFEFGKYAAYIVPAYLISLLVIGALVADTVLRARHWKREVERREEYLATDKTRISELQYELEKAGPSAGPVTPWIP
jgi:heme exporter protein CcmD